MGIISEYVKRLNRRDTTLKSINLYSRQFTDSELVELADCLLAHPDVVTHVFLGRNQLTDETGVKLARYLAASSTVKSLYLCNNQLGEATYLAVAVALRVNLSLRALYLYNNQTADRICVDSAFVYALRLNPVRPVESRWWLCSIGGFSDTNFKRLRNVAEKFTPPSMLEFLLCVHLDTEKIETKKH